MDGLDPRATHGGTEPILDDGRGTVAGAPRRAPSTRGATATRRVWRAPT